jgi:hypothetical protein
MMARRPAGEAAESLRRAEAMRTGPQRRDGSAHTPRGGAHCGRRGGPSPTVTIMPASWERQPEIPMANSLLT